MQIHDTKLELHSEQTKATCPWDENEKKSFTLQRRCTLCGVTQLTKAQVHTIYGSIQRRCFVRFRQKAWNERTKSWNIHSTRFFYERAEIALDLHWIISLHTTIVISALSISQSEPNKNYGSHKNRTAVTQKAITIWRAKELVVYKVGKNGILKKHAFTNTRSRTPFDVTKVRLKKPWKYSVHYYYVRWTSYWCVVVSLLASLARKSDAKLDLDEQRGKCEEMRRKQAREKFVWPQHIILSLTPEIGLKYL